MYNLVQQRHNVVVVGGPGTGKSHLIKELAKLEVCYFNQHFVKGL